MLTFKYIPDLFSAEGRVEKRMFFTEGQSLEHYYAYLDMPYELDKVIFVKDSAIVVKEHIPQDNETIIISPVIGGPVFGTIALIGVFLATPVAAGVTLGMLLTAAAVAWSIYSYLTYNKPKFGGGTFDSSPTYGWDGIRTMQDVDVPVPIIYGTHRVGGNRINVFVQDEVTRKKTWQDATLASEVQTGKVNTFQVQDAMAVKFLLDEQRVTLSYSAGVGVTTFEDAYFNCAASYDTSGANYAFYTVEYKKSADAEYVVFSNRVKSGLVMLPALSDVEGDWDVRVTLADLASNLPSDVAYYEEVEALKEDVGVEQNDKQHLSVLTAICEGEIHSIGDIHIKQNRIENFARGEVKPEVYIRKGTNDQSFIPQFDDIHSLRDISVTLDKDDSHVFTTVLNIDVFEVHILFTGGLYAISGSSLSNQDCDIKVEYKKTSEEAYTTLDTFTVTAKSRSAVRRIFRKDDLSNSHYDIRVTKIGDNSTNEIQTDMQWSRIDEIQSESLAYPNTALVGMQFLATEYLSGSIPELSFLVRGRKVEVPELLDGGTAIEYDEYYHDGTNYKKISDNSTINWDGSTLVSRWSANPIWCLRDLLLNNRFGMGNYIDSSVLAGDLAYMAEMAAYCDEMVNSGKTGTSDEDKILEKRFRLDIVIDSAEKALDLIATIGATCRVLPFYSNSTIKLLVDKIETPAYLYTMGNIIADSFAESWKSFRNVPNVLDVQFVDASKHYLREAISIQDSSLSVGNDIRKREIPLFGVTRVSQAIREARFMLRIARNVKRVITFQAGIDSLGCQAGDVVKFSHDVPQWGESGRILSMATASDIIIDRPVDIEAGTYHVDVRYGSDIIERKELSNSISDATTRLTVTSAFGTQPAAYDLYAVGKMASISKPYRVLSMRRTVKLETEIQAVEYISDIYTDEDFQVPDDRYSSLSLDIPLVANLSVNEKLTVLLDGSFDNVLQVWWQKPTLGFKVKGYAKGRVYLSENAGNTWQLVGETPGDFFEIVGGISTLRTYKIAVTTVTQVGDESQIENSPSVNISVLGKQALPEDVTGFDVVQSGPILYFSWDAVGDLDIAYYNIREGGDWGVANTIVNVVDATSFSIRITKVGTVRYWISAVDTSGNVSQSPVYDDISIETIEVAAIAEYDFWQEDFEFGRSADLAIEFANDYASTYNRRTLSLNTSRTWEDIEALGKGWAELIEDSDFTINSDFVTTAQYYTMGAPIEFTREYTFNVIQDLDYENVANGAVTLEISTSLDGITYSAFATVTSEAYAARYVKYRIKLQSSNSEYDIRLYAATVIHDTPELKVAGRDDIEIDAAGEWVNYGIEFTIKPRVNATVVNGVRAYPVITTKTLSDFFVTCYDSDAVGIVAEIDFRAEGN